MEVERRGETEERGREEEGNKGEITRRYHADMYRSYHSLSFSHQEHTHTATNRM